MPTDKQIQAARANGVLSKGPTTEQGKRNSAGNNVRHGLLARTIVLDEEDTERFLELLTGLMDAHQPRDASELALVETLAVARWRQLRVWGAQKTALDRDMALQDPSHGPVAVRAVVALRGTPESSCPPDVLIRYEIAFDRQYARALIRLEALQSRPANRQTTPYHPMTIGQTWKEEIPPLPLDPTK